MAKTLTITLPDNLDQALMVQSQRLNKSLEAIVVQALTKQLTCLSQSTSVQIVETDPLLRLIGLY
jgi:predicted transcriptional regulator